MEKIAALLFATTVITIFAYLMVFSATAYVGNGGEYWGYDGDIEPYYAASLAFDRGDFRFLEVQLRVTSTKIERRTPSFQHCDNYPLGLENSLRPSNRTPLHDQDSLKLATRFANIFNQTMARLLSDEMEGRCVQIVPE